MKEQSVSTVEMLRRQLNSAETDWTKHRPDWELIQKYVGIVTAIDFQQNGQTQTGQEDFDINDSTPAIAASQSSSYLQALIWNSNPVKIEPSDELLRIAPMPTVEKWFEGMTSVTIRNMNAPQAGLNNAMQVFCNEYVSFGNSGIGVFKNPKYRRDNNTDILIFRDYGVSNTYQYDGMNGNIEKIFVKFFWTAYRVVQEFCYRYGKFSQEQYDKLPEDIRAEYEKADNSDRKFEIIGALMEREEFIRGKEGKVGTRFKIAYFYRPGGDVFFEEDYPYFPIGMSRAIRLANSAYGKSFGAMLMSLIRSNNYISGKVIEFISKNVRKPLGTYDGAFGDKAIDLSSNTLNVFSREFAKEKPPIFAIEDMGDISAIVKWLIPDNRAAITTGFKTDLLLDTNYTGAKTATEMLQRETIRNKAVYTLTNNTKTTIETIIRGSIEILYDNDFYGYTEAEAQNLLAQEKLPAGALIIPAAVEQLRREGKKWYKISYLNEYNMLEKTQKLDSIIKFINVVSMTAQLFPPILEAIDFYKMLTDLVDCLGATGYFKMTADEFKAYLAAQAEEQRRIAEIQANSENSKVLRNAADANKKQQEANIAKAQGGMN